MGRHSNRADSGSPLPRWPLGLLAVAVGLVAFWWWPGRPVTLDDRGYDVTIALYRACNQQDNEAIEQLTEIVDALVAPDETKNSQTLALRAILEDADAGRWQNATRSCRTLLDAQADR